MSRDCTRDDHHDAGGGQPLPAPVAFASSRLIEPLTARELEILTLVCDGYSNQEISTRLSICLPTVKYHVTNIFGKLAVRRRTQAVALAVHLQLVRPDWMQMPVSGDAEHLLAKPRTEAAPRRAEHRTRSLEAGPVRLTA